MAKYAQCDNCGAKDDWSFDGIPILPNGLIIKVREESSGPEFEREIEICAECKAKVFVKFPKLAKPK